MDKLFIDDGDITYYNKKENYAIIPEISRPYYHLFAGKNCNYKFPINSFVMRWGNDFYNMFFGENDLQRFEFEFSQYTTGRKKIKYNHKLLSLINRMQSLSSIEDKNFSDFYDEFSKSWELYEGIKRGNIHDIYYVKTKKLKKIYDENFKYLQLLSEIRYTKINAILSIVTTCSSILAVIIALISLLFLKCAQ